MSSRAAIRVNRTRGVARAPTQALRSVKTPGGGARAGGREMTWTGPTVAVAPTAMTDADLVADVRAGADEAFEELYRRHQRGVGALVHRLVRDRGRAEDVTQEAFVAALRGIRASERH